MTKQQVTYNQVRDIHYYLQQVVDARPDDIAVALQSDDDACERAAALLSNLCLIRAAISDRKNSEHADPY